MMNKHHWWDRLTTVMPAVKWWALRFKPAPTTPLYHRHWIGMTGLRGYLPNVCDVYPDMASAAESVLFTNGWYPKDRSIPTHIGYKGMFEALIRDWIVDVSPDWDGTPPGNQYMSIDCCECDEPWIHSDSGSQAEIIEMLEDAWPK